MDASQNCIALIKGSEGKHEKLPDGRYRAYLDTLAKPPVPTIYCGLTKGVKMGMVITEAEGERMFSKEMSVYEDAVERLVTVPLNQNQFDALVSLTYNIGPGKAGSKGGLANSTLLKLLNQGKYEAAAAQFHRYKYAGGKVYNGLIKRRAAEAALFLAPMPDEAAGETPLPQSVEAAPVATVGEAITQSATIKTVAVAAPGAIYALFEQAYDWLFGVAKEAGPEILALKTTLTPFDALLKMTPTVLMLLTVIGLAVVVVRKISDRRAGTSV